MNVRDLINAGLVKEFNALADKKEKLEDQGQSLNKKELSRLEYLKVCLDGIKVK